MRRPFVGLRVRTGSGDHVCAQGRLLFCFLVVHTLQAATTAFVPGSESADNCTALPDLRRSAESALLRTSAKIKSEQDTLDAAKAKLAWTEPMMNVGVFDQDFISSEMKRLDALDAATLKGISKPEPVDVSEEAVSLLELDAEQDAATPTSCADVTTRLGCASPSLVVGFPSGSLMRCVQDALFLHPWRPGRRDERPLCKQLLGGPERSRDTVSHQAV